MLKNYFTIAWRHLRKNKVYSAINIIGLATGMAIALLIGLWIADEISYDNYAPGHRRLAVAMINASTKDSYFTGDVVSMATGQAFRSQCSELFSHTALTDFSNSDRLFSYGERTVSATALWAQQELPVMFGFRFLQGNAASAKDPSTVLIAQSLATALFGKTDPIGQTVKADDRLGFQVGGVYEDLPFNSTFHEVQVIMPWYNKDNAYLNSNTDWEDHNGHLYVELAPGITAAQATDRVHLLPTPHIHTFREEAMIYPLDKAHLYNEFTKGFPSGGRIRFVWLFGIIGSFVLFLACINFMNLSTARSERRAREVGIRKTIGSLTRQLIVQFLSESVLVALIAFVLSLVLVEVSLPFFNDLAAKEMHLPLASPLFWLATLAFALFTGLLAGSYPAFYLSRFQPVKVLKGSVRAGRYAGLPRQVLVVLQFTVSLTLIIGTIIVYRQILYTKDRPVGYSREGLFTVGINTSELGQHYEALRTELLQSGLAANVAASSMTLTEFRNNNGLEWRGMRPDQHTIMFRNVNVTPDYGATIGWKIMQGRDFSRDFPTDSNAIVLNDTAAKTIGIKNLIGETVKFFGKDYHVIGIAANMVNNSPYKKIEPAIFLGGNYTGVIIVRIKPGLAANKALAGMEGVFKKYNPASPFLYHFVDDAYAAKFEAEQRIGNLASVFTTLAIFISCLGLFGLASFVAEQRTKEIGVRKVLGASTLTLWRLLSKDFLRLTGLSILIAVPLAWYAMNKWLQAYNYHAPLSWWIFASAGTGILLITLITVSFQSLKAALMNPVKSLRAE